MLVACLVLFRATLGSHKTVRKVTLSRIESFFEVVPVVATAETTRVPGQALVM